MVFVVLGIGLLGYRAQLGSHIRCLMSRTDSATVLGCKAAKQVRREFDWKVRGSTVPWPSELQGHSEKATRSKDQLDRCRLALFSKTLMTSHFGGRWDIDTHQGRKRTACQPS